MSEERWLPVVGFEGRYEVSDHGRLRSIDRLQRFFRGKTPVERLYRGRFRKPQPKFTDAGAIERFEVNLFDGLSYSFWPLHTLVLEAFVGDRPTPEHQGAHWDGDPTHNHLSNLRWATAAENAQDKIRHGTIIRGEQHHLAKLTAAAVVDIRASSLSGPELARRFGVCRDSINAVRRGETWNHIATKERPE